MIVTVIKNTILWILILIFLSIPLLFLFLWRCLVVVFVKCIIHPSWTVMRVRNTMTTADAVYTRPLLNVGIILEVDGILDLNEFREHFSKVLLEPRDQFNRPVFGNLYANLARFGGICFKRRIDPANVNLAEHIYQVDLDKDETISQFTFKFYSAPYDDSKPLWKLALLQPENNDGNSRVFFKLHHSMGDGYSLIYLFDKLTNNSTASVVPPFNESFFDKVKLIGGAPTKFMEFGKRTSEIKNPLPMSGVNTQMVYKCFTLDLELVKKVRRKTGASVGPILLTLQGGAIRKLMLDGKSTEDDLPIYIYSGHSLPWPSHPRNKMCNEWTVGVFKVPIKNQNPLERLEETNKDYKEFLDKGMNRIIKRLMVPIMALTPVGLAEKMNDAEMSMSTSWSSILAGNDYRLLGKTVQHVHPFVGITNRRMAIVTISLSQTNKIDVTIGANMELIKDEGEMDNFAEIIQAELKKLVALCKS